MWWIQLIMAAVNMGLEKVEQDKEKARANAFKIMARQEGAAEAALLEEDSARARGRAATLAASSGGGLTGSAMDVLDDLGRQGRFRVRSALWSAETDATFGTRMSKNMALYGAAAQGLGGVLSSWSADWGKKTGGGGMSGGMQGMGGGLMGGLGSLGGGGGGGGGGFAGGGAGGSGNIVGM